MKLKQYLFGIGVLLISLSYAVSGLRYLIYTIPFLYAGYFLLTQSKLSLLFDRKLFYFWVICMLLFLFSFLLNIQTSSMGRFIKEISFFSMAVLGSNLLIRAYSEEDKDRPIKIGFILYFLVFLLFKGSEISLNIVDLLLNSSSETESSAAFIFGLFTIFFAIRGNLTYTGIASVGVLFASKRIVLAALVIAIIFLLLERKLSVRFLYPHRTLVKKIFILTLVIGANLGFIILFYNLAVGNFDKLFTEWTGLNAKLLFMGRLQMYRSMFIYTGGIPWFGIGFAQTSYLLESGGVYSAAQLTLLHSDILKMTIELGVVGFMIFLISLYIFSFRFERGVYLAMFCNIMALTDNVYVYMEVMFVFFFLLLSLNNHRELSGEVE